MTNYKVYTKNGCKYCDMVKKLLKNHKTTFINMSVMQTEEYQQLRDELIAKTNHRTFPWVFQGDNFIGGYTELNKKLMMSNNNLNF